MERSECLIRPMESSQDDFAPNGEAGVAIKNAMRSPLNQYTTKKSQKRSEPTRLKGRDVLNEDVSARVIRAGIEFKFSIAPTGGDIRGPAFYPFQSF